MAIVDAYVDQVQQVYIAYYGRPADPVGLDFWTNKLAAANGDLSAIIDAFGNSAEANSLFGGLSAQQTVNTLFNQLFGRDADVEGLLFYANGLAAGTMTAQSIALNVLDGAKNEDKTIIDNKLAVAKSFTNGLDTTDEIVAYSGNTAAGTARSMLNSVDASTDTAAFDVNTTITAIKDGSTDTSGTTFTLTNGSDKATANVFNADMVFTPSGDDRILSLQDEDELTGLAGRTDNTLNAEIGHRNANEGTSGVVTPELNNIQIVNLDWTGSTTTVDLRYADDIQTLNINKITSDATTVIANNITTAAANLKVADAADAGTNVTFNYQQGVLTGDNTASLELNDVLAATVTQNALVGGNNIEGFETVNLNAVNGVQLAALTVNEMETLNITGSGTLQLANLTAATGAAPAVATEYTLLGAAGIANPAAVGLLKLDGSAFDGNMVLDITNALGGFNDPQNSGARVHTEVTAGKGDDVLWTSRTVTATTATNRDVIDGGEGTDVLKTTAGVQGNTAITNIETLELRQQGAAQTVDFDAFDANLAKVVMRDENPNNIAGTFTLNDLGATLASGGNLVLRHSVTEAPAGSDAVVVANLKDASGSTDTVALTVENDLNTGTLFDYTLTAGGTTAATTVENVTIADNDTETNIVALTNAQNHTGTVTLTGGVAGQGYTVSNSLVAATVDASAQKSNLNLTVGDTTAPIAKVTQSIKLGEGDDTLTFQNIDDFQSTDSITDAGGSDTVRAAFSENSTLSLANIENLHILATENVALGLANADVDNLVIIADIAADQTGNAADNGSEPFNIGGGVAITDIMTLNDTKLTELNFSADLDTDNDNTTANRALATAAANGAGGVGTAAGDAAYKTVISDESTVATFNGVTLANNTANALTVNINSGLDDVIYGATAYNLGQLTAHGVTSMDIKITDEDKTAGAPNAVTNINNIFAKNMTSLTVSATDDVNLNTVSGSALNNSLTTFDASAVGGDVTATVISLGDNAKVTLANGDHTFSALGSAGKSIEITSGNGNSTITGSAQSDTITTGTGWDTVRGDRGDNVITTGAGNDTVTAKDGNDTVSLGTGIDTYTDNLNTGINASLATNTVSMAGGVAGVRIDIDGNGAVGATEIDQGLAVGAGSDLTVSWVGNVLQTASAVLDGRVAVTDNAAGAATIAGTANSDLVVVTGAGSFTAPATAGTATGVKTVNGGAGNDVAFWTGSAALDGLVFNGGAGNDAAVGTINSDIFTGGAGADKFVMQDVAAGDSDIDTVVIADGDSTASAWDVVAGFDAGGVASALGTVAGTATAGDDILDLDDATIAAVAAGGANGVNGTNAGAIQSHRIGADGVITFDTDDTNAFSAVNVGTGAGQISLADALAYLAANVTAPGTVMFNYDANGDDGVAGVINDNTDSTFVFQNGVNDTVVELVGVYAGLEAAGGAGVNLINIG